MREFENYIRYAMPGIASIIPLCLAFLISDYKQTVVVISEMDSIGPALALVLGSGGLGFLYSGIYFALYWSLNPVNFWAINHIKLLDKFIETEKIIINPSSTTETKKINKREAWERIGVIWDIALAENKQIVSINDRVKKLNVRLHGIGCTIVGLFSSLAIWAIFHYHILDSRSKTDLLAIASFVIIIIFFICNYFSLKRIHQSTSNKALSYYMHSVRRKHIILDDYQ